MKLVDLTRPLDPKDIEKFPENRRSGAAVMVPDIEYQRPAFEGADAVCANFGCTKEDLPDGEGWGAERLHINTHLGTHVDAPLHYGSTCEGRPARTITPPGRRCSTPSAAISGAPASPNTPSRSASRRRSRPGPRNIPTIR